MDFQLSAHVFYEDSDSERYATTFYNETTTFHEPGTDLDPKTLFTYAMYAAVVGLLLLVVVRSQSSSKPSAASKPKKASTGPGADNEWLDGIVNVSGKSKKQAVGAKPKSPSKSKK